MRCILKRRTKYPLYQLPILKSVCEEFTANLLSWFGHSTVLGKAKLTQMAEAKSPKEPVCN